MIYTCQYCGRIFNNAGCWKKHQNSCIKNPDSIKGKYNNMTNDELLELVKQYSSRKETPQLLIKECKKRGLSPWAGQYSEYHNMTDEKLKNELEQYNKKIDIPGALKRELKRRKIELPVRFTINPHRKDKSLCLIESNELFEKIKDCKDSFEIKEKGLYHILEELRHRNFGLPKNFNQKLTYSKYHYCTNEELEEIFNEITQNKYSSKNQLCKAGYSALLKEMSHRDNLKNLLDCYFYPNKQKYNNLFDIELLNIPNNFSNRNELLNEYPDYYEELKRRGLSTKVFRKNAHPEYKNMSDDEIILEAKTVFCGKNIKESNKINRPLINQLRNRKLLYIIFPESEPSVFKNRYKREKLNILTEYDLNNLHWTIILDLIGEDKLPAEFSKLCKFGENTPERKKMIQDLIDTYNIEVDDSDVDEIEDTTVDENIEEEVSYIPKEEILNKDIYNEDEETELKPLKEIKEISKIIKEDNIEVFSTGDKWLHIISKEMSKLWNAVLRDNENHNTNTVNDIKNKLNGTLTKFEEYIYTEFLKQYEEIINIKIS